MTFRGSGSHPFIPFLVSLASFLTACGQSGNAAMCESDADCALGFRCFNQECVAPTGTPDGLDRMDSGSPFVIDAGTTSQPDGGAPRPVDAGRPAVDASTVNDAQAPTDAGSNADGGGQTGCGPAACLAQGAQCGDIVDPCSSIVSCGSCDSGQECGERGTPFANQCRCQPQPWAELEAQCGRVIDNCGVERRCENEPECQGCSNNQTCRNNQCACVPLQCSDVNAECGQIDTGCNWMRNCGGCTAPERCGGPGVRANTCGCQTRVRSTNTFLFRTARNVNAADGSTDWEQLSKAEVGGGGGADIRVQGRCRNQNDHSTCERRSTTSEYLRLTNSAIDVPRGARIVGIRVRVFLKKTDSGTANIEEVALVGPRVSDNRARSITFPENYDDRDFGDSGDLWGRTWTAEEINASNFGVRIQMSASAGCQLTFCPETKVDVDYASVKVFYENCE